MLKQTETVNKLTMISAGRPSGMCRNLNSVPSLFLTLTTRDASMSNLEYDFSSHLVKKPLEDDAVDLVPLLRYFSNVILALWGGLAVGTSWFAEEEEDAASALDEDVVVAATPTSCTTRSPLSPRIRSATDASNAFSLRTTSCCSLFSPQWGQRGSPVRSELKHFKWNQCFHFASLRHWRNLPAEEKYVALGIAPKEIIVFNITCRQMSRHKTEHLEETNLGSRIFHTRDSIDDDAYDDGEDHKGPWRECV